MSNLKTQREVCTEFLENLIIKSDDELLVILNQDFKSEDYCDEEGYKESFNLNTITEFGLLFDFSDNSKCSFQVLAVLCATNKAQSFERIKNHYNEGTFNGVIYFSEDDKIKKLKNNKNFVFNISFEKITFESLQQALKIDGNTIWLQISKDYFKYGWNDALSNSGAKIEECSETELEHCSKSTEKVTFAIPLEALTEDPIEDDEF